MSTQDGDDGGWTFVRVVGLIIGLIGLIGFGCCSFVWIVLVGSDTSYGKEEFFGALLMSLPGLVITWLCFLLIRKMIRDSQRRSRERSN